MSHRDSNRKRIILAIMIKPDTQAGIARRTILSQATVSTAVRDLEKDGIVRMERNSAAQGKGGRGVRVCLQGAVNVAVGVDLGFNHVTVIARRVDEQYDRVKVQQSTDGANRGLAHVIPLVKGMIEEAVAETGRTSDDIISVGIAVPRMIDPRSGTFAAPVLPPWSGEGGDPAIELARALGVRVVMDNDANLGALAEQTYGGSDHLETVVYVKASTGIGSGLIVGGNLLRGRSGIAGELGHLTMDPHGVICQCGGRGCLETIIGAEYLIDQVRKSQLGNSADLPGSLAALIAKAHANDAVCVRALQDAGRLLGRALAQLCNLFNPDVIVLGGQLAAAKDLVLKPCREALERFALSGAVDPSTDFELRLSNLKQRAEALGALVLGLSSILSDEEIEKS
ncbi:MULTISPECIES: ROK family transcriptional regulator [Streptomyces]|uniref:ROK family transcriptional regulator n=1 Tax=Streptomyces TaxID=1883 RepID=UPI0018E054E5|nr:MULTISPECIES: ROK family transcriptional regulator [Streptomyces]MCZ4094997.1 ROK family transcriptional regulator [Streptomyces sp. H39-C1]